MRALKRHPRVFEAVIAGLIGAGVGLFAMELGLQSLISFWGDGLYVVIFFSLALAGCGLLLGPMRGRRAAVLSLLAIEALYAVVVLTSVSRHLAHGIVRDDGALSRADAVFVFGSSLQRNGEMSDIALSRLLHGLEVVTEGWTPHLILSELAPPHRSYTQAAKRLMQHLHIEREILSVGPVWRSRDEAKLVAQLCKEKGWKKIIAVTSPLHSRRACATLEREGLTVVCSPSVENRYDAIAMPQSEDRLRAFSAAIHEHLGLWYYRQRGWI